MFSKRNKKEEKIAPVKEQPKIEKKQQATKPTTSTDDVFASKDSLIFFTGGAFLFFVLMSIIFKNLTDASAVFAGSLFFVTFLFLMLHKTREGIHPIVDIILFTSASVVAAFASGASIFNIGIIGAVSVVYTLMMLRLHQMFFRMRQKPQGSEVWDFLIDLNMGKKRFETGSGNYLPAELSELAESFGQHLSRHQWHSYYKESELCAAYAKENQFKLEVTTSKGQDYLDSEDAKLLANDFGSTPVPFMSALSALKIISYFLNDKSVPIKMTLIRKQNKELAETINGTYALSITVSEQGILLNDTSKRSKKGFNSQVEEYLNRFREKSSIASIQMNLNSHGMYHFYIQFTPPIRKP